MTAGNPRTRHTDTTASATAQAGAADATAGDLPSVASEIALDLREWARRVDRAVDELYVQIERIPGLIEEGEVHGAHRSAEDIRRSAQRPE